MADDECLDLKNIQYKTMLLNGKNSKLSTYSNTSATVIEEQLQKEMNITKNLSWTKLDRGEKMKKLKEYATKYIQNNDIDIETDNLYQYLIDSLDRNRLQKVKEINYNKNNGTIESIPCLIFNTSSNRFTLKKNDKRVSTLSSLSTGTKSTRKRIIKNNDKLK